ncbi:EcoKI restriction-modification system protein HsdS [Tautonia plasticadhaerens]|uniref:EcoKI restriction-modification system protein HsdS n=1 Tax=Tautonia plasticadhaerens TaxID=2527974 RepID=A0A518GYN2_9BACT|nr:EcoKI restriction-modification system protein HsdS [Tautonia plasticadhaerens]
MTKPDDVAFISKGTVGRVGYLRPDQPEVVFAPQVCYWRVINQGCIHPRFLYYMLTGPEFQANLHAVKTHGSMVADYVSLADQHAFVLTLPPIDIQADIGRILGSLDDKIDLNRRMNATLEAIARTLFRSWFLDFDPVRAKMEGRQPPVIDSETAALFPSSFADSSLGPIPEGWAVGPLLDQAGLISGGTPKTSESAYWDGGIPWASAKDVSQCGDAFLINTERSITDLGLANSSTKIIPKLSTVVVARGATTGRFTMFGGDIAMNQTCYALRSRTGHHFYLNSLFRELVDDLIHAAHGSVFDTITTTTFERAKVILPPPEVQTCFELRVSSLFGRVLANLNESRTLVALRDTLLPKLLSGEVRVKHAEQLVESRP